MDKTLPTLYQKLAAAQQQLRWAEYAFGKTLSTDTDLLIYRHQALLALRERVTGLQYVIAIAEHQATVEAIKQIGFPVSHQAGTLFIHFPNTVKK